MGASEGNEPETGDAGLRRSTRRIAFQLARASVLVWIGVSLIAWCFSRKIPGGFSEELGTVSFFVMFLVIVVGGWMVFSPQGDTHRFLNAIWPGRFGSVGFMFPHDASGRDLTGQELGGGISPGTVALVVALELLAASVLLTRG